MYEVRIGQDMSCYANIEIPEDTPLTRDALKEIVERVIDDGEWNGEEVVFEEDWSTTCAARVVSVRDEKGNYLAEDVAIDPSPFDAGQQLQNWLKGHGSLQSVISAAAKFNLIDEPVMEQYAGHIKLPGCGYIQVDFECRKGATREEKDLAFFEALAQIGTVDYGKTSEEVNHGV